MVVFPQQEPKIATRLIDLPAMNQIRGSDAYILRIEVRVEYTGPWAGVTYVTRMRMTFDRGGSRFLSEALEVT